MLQKFFEGGTIHSDAMHCGVGSKSDIAVDVVGQSVDVVKLCGGDEATKSLSIAHDGLGVGTSHPRHSLPLRSVGSISIQLRSLASFCGRLRTSCRSVLVAPHAVPRVAAFSASHWACCAW